jgi:type IV secretory pathway VirB4 component
MPNKKSSSPSQQFLAFKEIKNDTVIMNNGTLLAVIGVASTNFALQNQDEQNALISGYQNFLNSLGFGIQILMQSRMMDVSSYLDSLRKLMEQQTNELLRVQTAEYIEFIGKLVENASIMSKTFYVIVPYNAAMIGKATGGVGGLFKPKAAAQQDAQDEALFQENKLKLEQRVNTVVSGLNGLGMRAMMLKTPELVELLYNSYNFGAGQMLDATKLGDINITS